ncbi:MAG: ABC transporter ATP-binding protein/permease, partial [Clostridia bacterium]|nr:ABC transporter ATP-binding protein/permease [Clostridia bacterium]
AKIKRELLMKINSLSYSQLDNIGVSTLITRMTSDANQVQSGINLTLRLFLRSPFIVFGAMIMAFTIDVKSAFVFVVAIPLLSSVVLGIMLASIPLYKAVQERLDKVLSLTRENLSGVRVIRAFGRENIETQDFDEKSEKLNERQNLVGRVSALLNPLTYILINFAVIVLIYIGGLRVNGGILTQGAVVSLYNYMLLILVELIKLANLIITITKSAASENRIESILDSDVLQFNSETVNTDKTGNVEFKNVSMSYDGSPEMSIKDISFKAQKGQTVGIIGGTGSGKTTLINLIPRFYDATDGEVLVDGVNVNKYPINQLRNKIGIVPQKAVLFKGTVRDNLLWGNNSADENTLTNALKVSQSIDFVEEKGGLDSEVEQGGRNFSGGQRQRLTIARALVRKPEILILDDSTSALDFATDLSLRKALKALDYNPTVFVVTQRTASIQNADIIIVLDDGETVGIGTHKELLESCEVYKEIYNSQFKEKEELS